MLRIRITFSKPIWIR